MVVGCEFIADVVNQRGYQQLIIGTVAQRAGRRLQRVAKAADRITFERMIQLHERSDYVIRQLLGVIALRLVQQLVVLARAVCHSAETHHFVHAALPATDRARRNTR
jgi:hypothetical protein